MFIRCVWIFWSKYFLHNSNKKCIKSNFTKITHINCALKNTFIFYSISDHYFYQISKYGQQDSCCTSNYFENIWWSYWLHKFLSWRILNGIKTSTDYMVLNACSALLFFKDAAVKIVLSKSNYSIRLGLQRLKISEFV